jgi:hypothetical protein
MEFQRGCRHGKQPRYGYMMRFVTRIRVERCFPSWDLDANKKRKGFTANHHADLSP